MSICTFRPLSMDSVVAMRTTPGHRLAPAPGVRPHLASGSRQCPLLVRAPRAVPDLQPGSIRRTGPGGVQATTGAGVDELGAPAGPRLRRRRVAVEELDQ